MTTDINWRMSPGTVGDLEAWIEFDPAYDCRRGACPSCGAGRIGDHGRHGVDMTWYLRGHDLAVQFKLFTGWHHPIADRGLDVAFSEPLPADIGYHSARPVYEGQYEMMPYCLLLGGRCYYDGSGLRAQEGFNLLRSSGGRAVWQWMHEEFVYRLNERSAYESNVPS